MLAACVCVSQKKRGLQLEFCVSIFLSASTLLDTFHFNEDFAREAQLSNYQLLIWQKITLLCTLNQLNPFNSLNTIGVLQCFWSIKNNEKRNWRYNIKCLVI